MLSLLDGRGGTRPRWVRSALAGGIAVALVAGLLSVPASAVAQPMHLSPQVEPIDRDGGLVAGQAWPYAAQSQTPSPEPVWPRADVARVTLSAQAERRADTGAVRVGGLPMVVERAAGSGGSQWSALEVRVLDRAAAPAGWRSGVLMRVGSPQEAAVGTAKLSVDYRAFRFAYGGDWASRLRLWQLPECALTTPTAPGCAAKPLLSANDSAAGVVSAQVPVMPMGAAGATRTARLMAGDGLMASSPGTLVALAAGPSGSGGDFGATSLSPSATWSAGGSSGAFTWSYPMRMPPSTGGPAPKLALAYSSSSVDGRSAVTNNQPSWLGEGFEYWPGYIERRYVPCAEDTAEGANNGETGDMCWRSDNATMSLNGGGSELIFEDGKGWHSRREDGSKIEKLSGAGNGDNDGEHWKVTGPDGTQYFFGLQNLPGQSTGTSSTWTVPVAGNHANEPCHAASFTGSFCVQAWRWNLDYAVDVRGNTISYWYAPEPNKYARNLSATDAVSYTRGGTLTRIDYGTWDRVGSRSVTPTAQVLFEPGDRCVSGACGTHDATNWPDTPWDQDCGGATCAGKYTPTFWSTKRLAKISTRVWDTTKSTPAWQDVESWTFTHSFPPPGDGSDHAGLWLERIVHAGHVGGTETMPPVTFTPISLPNRVLTQHNTTNNWQRIDSIITETGAKLDLEYSLPECTSSSLPTPETNGKLCYPVLTPDPADPQGEALVTEWWHKYVVRSLSESDVQLAGGHQAPPVFTSYEYVGQPAWHYADDDGLTKADRKTWDQYRGYAAVKTRVGDVPGAQTLTETRYLRGMHNDRAAAPPSTAKRTVTVAASVGSETVYDEDQFAGMVREEIVYNGVESKPVSKTVNVPWLSPSLASRTINGNTVSARFTNTRISYTATALGVDGARGWRTGRSESWFSDTYGTSEQAQSDGDLGKTGDEKCVVFSYNRNPGRNLLQTMKQTTTTALPCGTPPSSPDHIISDERNSYDGAASPDTTPTYGSITRVEQLRDWSQAGGTAWQTVEQSSFDAFGRLASTTDIRGTVVTRTYTPSVGGPVTKVATTTAAPWNWTTSTEVSPYWGVNTKTTDLNGRGSDVTYDALGRVAKVWEPGWAKAGHETRPSAEYTYTLAPNRDAYPFITTKTLHAGGGYATSYQILDSLLRPRQTQTAGIGGGIVVADTIYDKRGLAATSYHAHVEPGAPSGALWWEPEWSVPALTRTVFDNAGRTTASVLLAGDGVTNLVEKWRTTIRHEGDLTRTTPPAGGTPTTVLTDFQGRTIELREHTTAQGVDGAYQTTSYTYNAKDQLAKATDHAHNEWTYTFDVKGRQTRAVDPDKGTTTSDYNDLNQLVKVTDGRSEVLWYTYDALGRKKELRDDSATGALRAKWSYDKLYTGSVAGAKGQLTEVYRYEPAGSGNIYKWQVGGFTTRYQPSSVNYVIPAIEGNGLASTWNVGYGYTEYDGSPTSILYPAGGGLASETVTTQYDATTGLPTELETGATGVGNYVAAQQYTAYGEPTLTTRKTAGGVYVEEATYYDEITRRVTRTAVQPETASGTAADRTYSYDNTGNVLGIADLPQVGAADTQCFRYDTLRRLRSAWTPASGPTACAADPAAGSLAGPAPYWLDWTIDPVGNRTTEISRTATSQTTRDYGVPTGGQGVARPHAVTQVTTKVTGQADVITRYGYDNAGNTTCRPTGAAANTCPPGNDSQSLAWDAEGRLSAVTVGTNPIQTNIYQADGSRWISRDAGGTTLYLPGQEIRRNTAGAVTATRYYTFGGQTVASRDAAGLTWLHADHQGTALAAINAATQAVTTRRQTPYGQPRGTNPSWPNPRGFVGGDNDPTGLTHLGAREYDPGLGRFISVDPVMDLADPQQWNAYSYAGASPVTVSDPDGLREKDTTDKTGGGGTPLTGCHGANMSPSCREDRGPAPGTDVLQPVTPHIFIPLSDPHFEPMRKAYNDYVAGTSIADPSKVAYDVEIEMMRQLCNNTPGLCSKEVTQALNQASPLYPLISADGGAQQLAQFLMLILPAGPVHGRPTRGRLCGNSFTPDTHVAMADGTAKPIKDVEPGDRVTATDPETGDTSPRIVTAQHINYDDDLTDVTVINAGAVPATSVINTTAHHLFWDHTRGSWTAAADLTPGHRLRTPDGVEVTVAEVRAHPGEQHMYDLTVDTIHTYYVLAGHNPVLVHNTDPGCGTGGGVWDDMVATQPKVAGTGGLPKSFELTTQNGRFWVHPNVTEHIVEDASALAARGASPEMVGLATQQQLRSLQAAVVEATRGGIIYDRMIIVGGWELKFGAPRADGLLPAVTHGRMVG